MALLGGEDQPAEAEHASVAAQVLIPARRSQLSCFQVAGQFQAGSPVGLEGVPLIQRRLGHVQRPKAGIGRDLRKAGEIRKVAEARCNSSVGPLRQNPSPKSTRPSAPMVRRIDCSARCGPPHAWLAPTAITTAGSDAGTQAVASAS